MIIEFSEDNLEFIEMLKQVYGQSVEDDFIESRNFNGDLAIQILSIVLPITDTVINLISLYRDTKKDKKTETNSTRRIRLISKDKEIVLENYEIEEVKLLFQKNTE